MVKYLVAWIEFHIHAAAAHLDEMSDQLTSSGALAVTIQDAGDAPIYEPTTDTLIQWPENILIGLFAASVETQPIIQVLNHYKNIRFLKDFQIKEVADEDWVRRSLDSFKPLQFNKLWVCPSWLPLPDPSAVNIILDPGVAFGTGSHPTTMLCLQWLADAFTTEKIVIDYGCGSGILGIAALKLGADAVMAVDIDPQALEATRLNAQKNAILASQLQTYLPNELPDLKCDLLIANILAKPLKELATTFAKIVKPNGKILLSGILKTQINEILEYYNPLFYIENQQIKEDWVSLVGIRANNN